MAGDGPQESSETEAKMSQTAHTERFANFAEFYPFYLEEHRNVVSRRLHFVGSPGLMCWLGAALDNRALAADAACARQWLWVGMDRAFLLREQPPGHIPAPRLQPDGRLGDVQGY